MAVFAGCIMDFQNYTSNALFGQPVSTANNFNFTFGFKDASQYLTLEGYPLDTECWYICLNCFGERRYVCGDSVDKTISNAEAILLSMIEEVSGQRFQYQIFKKLFKSFVESPRFNVFCEISKLQGWDVSDLYISFNFAVRQAAAICFIDLTIFGRDRVFGETVGIVIDNAITKLITKADEAIEFYSGDDNSNDLKLNEYLGLRESIYSILRRDAPQP